MKKLFSVMTLSLALSVPMAFASADSISERQANFKKSGQTLRMMRSQIANDDFQSIADGAKWLAEWGATMPEHFPEGSGGGQTDALPSIWQNFENFTALANNFETASLALHEAALTNDGAAVQNAMQAVGRTCGACHQSYRK